jgi:hypothetical protein
VGVMKLRVVPAVRGSSAGLVAGRRWAIGSGTYCWAWAVRMRKGLRGGGGGGFVVRGSTSVATCCWDSDLVSLSSFGFQSEW